MDFEAFFGELSQLLRQTVNVLTLHPMSWQMVVLQMDRKDAQEVFMQAA